MCVCTYTGGAFIYQHEEDAWRHIATLSVDGTALFDKASVSALGSTVAMLVVDENFTGILPFPAYFICLKTLPILKPKCIHTRPSASQQIKTTKHQTNLFL